MSEVREDAELKAARLGLKLVKPLPNQVFVDLDSIEEFHEFERRFSLAKKLWPLATYKCKPSVSGGDHCHAYVTIPELVEIKNDERIAIQAALGSDPFRELLAIHHGRAGYIHTSVFFENPTEKDDETIFRGLLEV